MTSNFLLNKSEMKDARVRRACLVAKKLAAHETRFFTIIFPQITTYYPLLNLLHEISSKNVSEQLFWALP